MTVATPSVLVIARSAVGTSVSVSVAELFPGFGSVTPAGAAIVAVLTSVPVAAAETVPTTVNVAVPPGGRLTLAPMFPAPAAGHVPPPAPTHVQVAPIIAAGNVSATVAPTAVLGPALLATIVYAIPDPGTIVATPSVLVIARSATGVSVSVSVAVLLAAFGSTTVAGTVTVAVFEIVPVAPDATAAVTV